MLFVTELQFSKIIVPKSLQKTSNVNIECANDNQNNRILSCNNPLGALMSLFCCSDINVFSNDYGQWELCKIWLLLINWRTTPEVLQYRSSTRETPLLQLLLVLHTCTLADYPIFHPSFFFNIHRVINSNFFLK